MTSTHNLGDNWDIEEDVNGDLVFTYKPTGESITWDGSADDIDAAGKSISNLSSLSTDELSFTGVFADVREYGAVGDGATDDSGAFQDAANNADTVIVPSGDYLIESSVDPDQTYFVGPQDRSARIVAGDLGNNAVFQKTGGPTDYGFVNLEIDGSNGWTGVTGYDPSRKAIYTNRGKNLLVKNCYVHDTPATAIGCDSVYNAWYLFNEVENAGSQADLGSNGIGVGVGLVGGEMPTYIIGNTIQNVAHQAIAFESVNTNDEWGHFAIGNMVIDSYAGVVVDGRTQGAAVTNNIVITDANSDTGYFVGDWTASDTADNVALSNNIQRGPKPASNTALMNNGATNCHATGNVWENGDITNGGTGCTVNGVGKEGAGAGNTPTTSLWQRGNIVRNFDDGTIWLLTTSDAWIQLA